MPYINNYIRGWSTVCTKNSELVTSPSEAYPTAVKLIHWCRHLPSLLLPNLPYKAETAGQVLDHQNSTCDKCFALLPKLLSTTPLIQLSISLSHRKLMRRQSRSSTDWLQTFPRTQNRGTSCSINLETEAAKTEWSKGTALTGISSLGSPRSSTWLRFHTSLLD